MVAASRRIGIVCALACLGLHLVFISVAQARSITAYDLLQLRDIDGLSISADHSMAAFQVREPKQDANTYNLTWQVINLADQSNRIVADGGEVRLHSRLGRISGSIIVDPPLWSADLLWIVFLRQDQGRTQVWRARVDGAGVHRITSFEADAVRIIFSKDGERLFVETTPSAEQRRTALQQEGQHGFLFDRRFMPYYSTHPTLPVDAALFSGQSEAQSTDAWLMTIDWREQTWRTASDAEVEEYRKLKDPLSPPEAAGAVRGAVAASPLGSLAWAEAADPDRQGAHPPLSIAYETPAGITRCAHLACQEIPLLRGLWWRDQSELIFATSEVADLRSVSLFALDIETGNVRPVLRTDDQFATPTIGRDCLVAAGSLVCLGEGPRQPGRLISVDLDTGQLSLLFDPNPHFAEFDLGSAPRALTAPLVTGGTADGLLVLPPDYRGEAPLPLIIVTYRCDGFLRGGAGDEYPIYAFAARGFAVLCFSTPDLDYSRLATQDWPEYLRWARGPGYPEMDRVQEGLEALLAQLIDQGIVARERIGYTGLSYGADVGRFLMFRMGSIATYILSGVGFEPIGYYLVGQAGREVARSHFGWSAPEEDPQFWRDISLSSNIDRVKAPTLLNVSDHEMLAATQAVALLQDADRAVEMFVFPDEYHVKWQPAHRAAIYHRNLEWMDFWLRNLEIPDSQNAERWRELRDRHCSAIRGELPAVCR